MNGSGAEPRADSLIVLIPSPLLGPHSWFLVRDELRERGWKALVSVDLHDPLDRQPCWRRTVGGVEAALRDSVEDRPVVLVAHSGSGPLLPAIGAIVQQPIAAYLFVDAGLPSGGISRLEAIAAEDATSAAELRATLDAGLLVPVWTEGDLRQLVPDPIRRQALLDELRPRGAEYWTEALPDVSRWPNAPCGYVRFSAAYLSPAEHASRAGWPARHLPAGHFHQLVDPPAVTDAIVDLLAEFSIRSQRGDAAAALKGATT